MTGVGKNKTIVDRLLEKTIFVTCPVPGLVGDCHVWIGPKSTKGYGRICVNSKPQQVHRVAYEAYGGIIPPGKQLDHLCRVRACWNPKHVEPVTNRENILRGVGLSAENARKTHCKRGHEFTEGNTQLVSTSGQRKCRTCNRMESNERYDRKRQAKAANS